MSEGMQVDEGKASTEKTSEVQTDVEMKADEGNPDQIVLSTLQQSVRLLERASRVVEGDSSGPRLVWRALRQSFAMRKRLSAFALRALVNEVFPAESGKAMMSWMDEFEKKDGEAELFAEMPSLRTPGRARVAGEVIPEIRLYVQLMVILLLIDASPAQKEQAATCADDLMGFVGKQIRPRRSAQPISAKVFFYYALTHERIRKLDSIRGVLLSVFRSCCLRHDVLGQATLICAILRSYLASKQLRQAALFVGKTTFPPTTSNHLWARFYYYRARIAAVQLDYSSAFTFLMNAVRKAPHSVNASRGFRYAVHKLLVVVQLLMGEVPERSMIDQQAFRGDLKPYMDLAASFRVGDLNSFTDVLQKYRSVFLKDANLLLIMRLRHNVIRAGLRKINVSYRRISLEDICAKLHLGSVDETECVVTKAIRDGVVSGSILHDEGILVSAETTDVYSTLLPQEFFDRRIRFCMDLHDETVRALRFPKDMEGEEDKAERKTSKELAEEEEELLRELDAEDE